GAGNLLGGEQSGHAQAVGVDLYLRWLEDEVRRLKQAPGVQSPEQEPPEVIFDRPAHLPEHYLPDEDAKLDFYRRLARAGQFSEISALREELRDRFGPLPPEAETLLLASELRALGARLGLEMILVRGDEARLTFRRGARPNLLGLHAAFDSVQFAADVRRTVPLSLRLTRLGGEPMGRGLVRVLTAALNHEHP
ncbi:MAG: TRCF domain-containing protein, partial [Gemmatimonadales bacterium]